LDTQKLTGLPLERNSLKNKKKKFKKSFKRKKKYLNPKRTQLFRDENGSDLITDVILPL